MLLRFAPADRPEPVLLPTAFPHLSRVTAVLPDGRTCIELVVYLPFPPERAEVQAKVGWRGWRSLAAPTASEPDYWHLSLDRIQPQTAIRFRYRVDRGPWQAIAPLTHLERVYETFYVPKVTYSWEYEPPVFDNGYVLLETTLEGLLAGYEGGVFAPRSREELFRDPIARAIQRTNLPSRLAELGIDGIMATIGSAMSDRSYLNPRFNYLTYDVANVDWQIGPTQEVMKLLDTLYGKGLKLVPDLAFVHQVRNAFPGALDLVWGQGGVSPYIDAEAHQHRDYGTWMFQLADPQVRQQLVEKIVAFAERYRLKLLRLGYLDGLIYQYSKRETNYGEIFLEELRAELRRLCPQTLLLGEVFAARDNPAIQNCIDILYAPYGFGIVEQTYGPPTDRCRDGIDFEALVASLEYAVASQQHNAIYAMLHDETCPDDRVSAERPDTPWAYGSNAAELARSKGEALIAGGLLHPEDLLDYARRLVRSTEALTLFCAKLAYMFSPGVDSLLLQCSETPEHWKFPWDSVSTGQLAFWRQRGLSDRQTYLLHKQHRLDMAGLRQIFRTYTPVDPEGPKSIVQIQVAHADAEHRFVAIWRFNPRNPFESILVAFNLGLAAFGRGDRPSYVLPLPDFDCQLWEVLFDGDWIDPVLWQESSWDYLGNNYGLPAYAPGRVLESKDGVLPLNIGAHSTIALKTHRQTAIPRPAL